MSKKSNYISTNRSKHYLKCHLIFVCKYRKKLLIGQLNDDIKQIFQSIADGSDFEIEVMESDIDHIHFLIRYITFLVYLLLKLSAGKTRIYSSNLVIASIYTSQAILVSAFTLVRWLLCLFNRRGFS